MKKCDGCKIIKGPDEFDTSNTKCKSCVKISENLPLCDICEEKTEYIFIHADVSIQPICRICYKNNKDEMSGILARIGNAE